MVQSEPEQTGSSWSRMLVIALRLVKIRGGTLAGRFPSVCRGGEAAVAGMHGRASSRICVRKGRSTLPLKMSQIRNDGLIPKE